MSEPIPDRAPDRVVLGPLEIVGHHHVPARTVATSGSLFMVTEWTTIEAHEEADFDRKRIEYWDEPARAEPVMSEASITVRRIPARTLARWEWESDYVRRLLAPSVAAQTAETGPTTHE